MDELYTTTLTVDGMTCHRDEAAIQAALKTRPGIVDVKVSRIDGTATVTSTKIYKEEHLKDKVEALGFRVRTIE